MSLFPKTFGGMDLEGKGKRLVTIGPKKYVFVKESGDYEWKANGIRARQNIHVDVLTMFERVLAGNVEQVDHWAITAGADFELRHSVPGEYKKLRFICLKGAVEDDGIRWWKDEVEFTEHAERIHPIGFIPKKSCKRL